MDYLPISRCGELRDNHFFCSTQQYYARPIIAFYSNNKEALAILLLFLLFLSSEYLKTNETDCIYIDCPYGSIPQRICR